MIQQSLNVLTGCSILEVLLVYKFYGEELSEMFGYEEHPFMASTH